jgi:hypothetical protein
MRSSGDWTHFNNRFALAPCDGWVHVPLPVYPDEDMTYTEFSTYLFVHNAFGRRGSRVVGWFPPGLPWGDIKLALKTPTEPSIRAKGDWTVPSPEDYIDSVEQDRQGLFERPCWRSFPLFGKRSATKRSGSSLQRRKSTPATTPSAAPQAVSNRERPRADLRQLQKQR